MGGAIRLVARDGVELALRVWPVPSARGTVVVVHGLGEHAGRYAHVAAALNAIGLGVVAHDQRGHGASGGARGVIGQRDDLLVDLAQVVDAVRRAHPGPLVLLGHSMGGLVAARFVAGALEAPARPWSRAVEALVLSSPALDPGMTPFQRGLARLGDTLFPTIAIANGLPVRGLSRDPSVMAAYRADPAVHDRIAPRLARFIVDDGPAVLALAPRWTVPTLLMWAGADRLGAAAGSERFAAAAPKAVVSAHGFPALFHEILNEPERSEVLTLLLGWLDKLPALQRKASPP